MNKTQNLAEAFGEIIKQYGAEEALRRLAYCDAHLESEGISEYKKSCGTRSIDESKAIEELKIRRLKRLPLSMLETPAPKKAPIQASEFTLAHLVDKLLSDGEYTFEELADEFHRGCSDLYRKDGMFPLSIYNGSYAFLKSLIRK